MYGAGELPLAGQLFDSVPTIVGRAASPIECAEQFDSNAISKLAETHLAAFDRIDDRGLRVVDKMPRELSPAGVARGDLFPRPRSFIAAAICAMWAVSCWTTDFRTIRWTNDPRTSPSAFGSIWRIMDHWRATLPVALHEVSYEELVGDFDRVARGARGRLRAGVGSELLRFPSHAARDSHGQQHAGATANLSTIDRPLAELRERAGRDVRGAAARVLMRHPLRSRARGFKPRPADSFSRSELFHSLAVDERGEVVFLAAS